MTIYRIPVEFTWPGPGSPGVNVWHARVGLPGGTAGDQTLQAAVDSVHAFYAELAGGNGHIGAPWAGGLRFRLGQVVDVLSQEVHSANFPEIALGDLGKSAPPTTQIVVGWRTTIAARRGQGRTFLGPLNDFCVATDGTMNAEVRGNVLTAAGHLLDRNKADTGWSLGVYGLEAAKTGPKGAKVLRDFTGFSVNSSLSVLRSRRD